MTDNHLFGRPYNYNSFIGSIVPSESVLNPLNNPSSISEDSSRDPISFQGEHNSRSQSSDQSISSSSFEKDLVDQLAGFSSAPQLYCAQHGLELVLYCVVDKKWICPDCAFLTCRKQHRNSLKHKPLTLLEAQNKVKELENIIEVCNKKEEAYNAILNRIRSSVIDNLTEKFNSIRKILQQEEKKRLTRVENWVNQLRQEICQPIEKNYIIDLQQVIEKGIKDIKADRILDEKFLTSLNEEIEMPKFSIDERLLDNLLVESKLKFEKGLEDLEQDVDMGFKQLGTSIAEQIEETYKKVEKWQNAC